MQQLNLERKTSIMSEGLWLDYWNLIMALPDDRANMPVTLERLVGSIVEGI